MDSATWLAFALTLTVLGGLWTVSTWRRNGAGHGLRAASITMLPMAAWLTGLLRLATEIGEDVGRWAARLVFSPGVWAGIALAIVAAAVFSLSGTLRRRTSRTRPPKGALEPPSKTPGEFDEIEAILRKRGIR